MNQRSRAEYFRAYREKQRRALNAQKGPKIKRKSKPRSNHLREVLFFILAAFTTFQLVLASSHYYDGSRMNQLILATLTELILIALVIFVAKNWLERVAQHLLLVGFVAGSVLPIVQEPINLESNKKNLLQLSETQQKILENKLIILHQQFESLQERSRISQAQQVAHKIEQTTNQLQQELQQNATIRNSSATKTNHVATAIMRLLYLFFNLLIVHSLARDLQSRSKESDQVELSPRKNHEPAQLELVPHSG